MSKHTMKINPVKLRAAIRSKSMSITAFARRVETKLGTFRAYLTGVADMPFLLIEKCADVLGIEPEDILDPSEGMEWEIRQCLYSFFTESEFKRLAGERDDLEHLRILKDVVPYLIAKKGTVFTAIDPNAIAQVMIKSRENVKEGGSATDGMSEEEVDVFSLLEGIDNEEDVSDGGDESSED